MQTTIQHTLLQVYKQPLSFLNRLNQFQAAKPKSANNYLPDKKPCSLSYPEQAPYIGHNLLWKNTKKVKNLNQSKLQLLSTGANLAFIQEYNPR